MQYQDLYADVSLTEAAATHKEAYDILTDTALADSRGVQRVGIPDVRELTFNVAECADLAYDFDTMGTVLGEGPTAVPYELTGPGGSLHFANMNGQTLRDYLSDLVDSV